MKNELNKLEAFQTNKKLITFINLLEDINDADTKVMAAVSP